MNRLKALFYTAACLFVLALGSFQLVKAQPEDGNSYFSAIGNCICIRPNGTHETYAYSTNCQAGGSSYCTEVECPIPPPACN